MPTQLQYDITSDPPPPQLKYDITSDPFPLKASASTGQSPPVTLELVATNYTPNDVILQGIIIQFPVGDAATDLTLDATQIRPLPPKDWKLDDTQYSNGQVQFIFHPNASATKLGTQQALRFVFQSVVVNSQVGTVSVLVTEGSNDCQAEHCPTKSLSITKFSYDGGPVWFMADETDISYNGTTTLRWVGPVGATYTLEYEKGSDKVQIPKAGDPPLANNDSYPVQLQEHIVVFTLNVEVTIDNQPLKYQPQVTITVARPTPKIKSFTITADPVQPGGVFSFTLNWETEFATQIEITADVGPDGQKQTLPVDETATSSSFTVTPTQPETTYTLTIKEGLQTSKSERNHHVEP